MPGLAEGNGPSYISSHSADVILSDIRPIKLKIEALRSINVLLDEFLYSILNTARSLSTDKLRASLLSLLPTSLGKEALLEAEVELRAYWERTGSVGGVVPPVEDDTRTFHLQWAFELLQLKCEAYSTLNESDEDPGAEARISERMESTHEHPPKATLVAPAALYLTAMLEAMCEHVLSNVGRVAARDSSRTSATINDLFIALCEDDSIYSLFKTMKAYEQIELLSKAPKTRRSKSFSRSDRNSTSRTSSPAQDLSPANSSQNLNSRSRQSSEGPAVATPSNSGSRSSFDKSRAMKMFMANNKVSIERDGDSQNGHKRTGSHMSDNSKYNIPLDEGERSIYEDDAMLQEFDDLMRSTSTMKVSLTPDRLKTMEVHKQEKDQRGNRRPVPLSFTSGSDALSSSRTTIARPTLRHVDSIIEDDEEVSLPKVPKGPRARQASAAALPSASLVGSGRARSVSTSAAAPRDFTRKASPRTTPPPPSFPQLTSPPPAGSSPTMMHAQNTRAPNRYDGNGFPPRTRVRQHNRESIDLDDVMGGSDDETPTPPVKAPPRSTSRRVADPKAPYVSAGTRELIEFLAEGPPEPKVSPSGRDFMDFLAQGPPETTGHYNASAISLTSNKKSGGRLQRMISKLNLGNGEKAKGGNSEGLSRSASSRPPPVTPIRPTMNTKASVSTLSSLANRPIPPRITRPPSPPPSVSPSRTSFDDVNENIVPQQSRRPSASETITSKMSHNSHNTSVVPAPRRDSQEKLIPRVPPPGHKQTNGYARNGYANGAVQPAPENTLVTSQQQKTEFARPSTYDTPKSPTPVSPARSPPPTRKPVPSTVPAPAPTSAPAPTPAPAPVPPPPSLSEGDLRDMHRLISRASTADECRVIFDMFIARSGVSVSTKTQDVEASYPSPSPSLVTYGQAEAIESALELSMVELLLGGQRSWDAEPQLESVVIDLQSTSVPLVLKEGAAVDSEDTPGYTPSPTTEDHSLVSEVVA